MKVGNSVWQDLYLRRPKLEAEYIHGPVVSLGEEHGVDVPFHRAALDFARRALEQADGPETIRLREVLDAVGGFPGKAGP